jgi:hypothetical protein
MKGCFLVCIGIASILLETAFAAGAASAGGNAILQSGVLQLVTIAWLSFSVALVVGGVLVAAVEA